MSDLKLAFDTLAAKQKPYDTYWDYYEGKHPLVYTRARLREVFKGLDANFVENWCSVVVDVPWERLVLERLEVANDPSATARLANAWARLDLNLDADDAHLAALVTGEAFEFVWPESEEEGADATAYHNDSRLCHVFYEADNPRRARMAAKWWRADDKRYRLNLYYVDRIEYYVTQPLERSPSSAEAFTEYQEPLLNPYGQIPVFHLRTGRPSVLDNAIPLQAAINKLLADEMITAEFGAFRQRYVISNADVGNLKNAPNEVWDLPAGDGVGQQTTVGEFSASDLGNFESAIERRVAALSAITKIPSYYFFRMGGQPPSGEALIAMEAPLNKAVRRIIARFTTTWQQMAAFMLRIDGYEVDPETVQVFYADPETVQPKTRAEIRQSSVSAGIPLITQLRREGWTDEQIAQMLEDRAVERQAAQESLAQALLEQQRRFDQEQNV